MSASDGEWDGGGVTPVAPVAPVAGRATKPWERAHPEFTTSESADRRRRRCARAHLHAVHTAHRGWAAPPGSPAWLAYRLKAAQPLAAALGSAVHAAMTTCVQALVAGAPLPSVDVLRAPALGELAERWRNSQRRLTDFWTRPKQVPVFLEALYGEDPDAAARARVREKLERVLTHLVDCYEVWYWVRTAAHGDVRLVAPFSRFLLPDDLLPEGVPVYAAPDLLVRDADSGAWHVIDFKSGRDDGVIDQVLTYALAAERGLGLDVRTPAARGVVVALDARPEDRLTVFPITPDDIAAAEVRLRDGITAARALLRDPVHHVPLEVDEVPGPRHPRTCLWCPYRALCHPQRHTLVFG